MTSTGQSGWQPDPFGIHEFRYLSSSGAPTKLVRDRGVESYDDPPTSASGTDLTDPAVAPTQDVAGITGTQDVNQRAEPATEAPTRPPAVRSARGLVSRHGQAQSTAVLGRHRLDGPHRTHRVCSYAVPDCRPTDPDLIGTAECKSLYNRPLPWVVGAVVILAIVLVLLGTTGGKKNGNGATNATPTTQASSLGPALTYPTSPATQTTAVTTTTKPASAPITIPTTPAPSTIPIPPENPVTAWNGQHYGNIETLDNDIQNISTADQELEQSIGGSGPLNYGPVLTASQQLASDVATCEKVAAIPDAQAEADWSSELSDLAQAAADYTKGFTDNANGDTTDGPPLIQRAGTEVEQAQIAEGNLRSRLSVAEGTGPFG